MPSAFSLKLLNNKYWYVRPQGGDWISTKWTTDHLANNAEVERAFAGLPHGHWLKLAVFDNQRVSKNDPEFRRPTVDFACKVYSTQPSICGIKDGVVIDPERHSLFKQSVSSELSRLKAKFGPRRLVELKASEILEWVHQMEAEGLAKWTIPKQVYRLSAVFELGKDSDNAWVRSNPVIENLALNGYLKNLQKTATRRVVSVSSEEVAGILEAADKVSAEWYLFLCLVTELGLRSREARTIQRRSLDLKAQTIHIETMKAKVRVSRTVNFGWNKALAAKLGAVAKGLSEDDFLFSARRGEAESRGKTWVIKNFDKTISLAIEAETLAPERAFPKSKHYLTFRDLRHTGAQKLKALGMSMDDIAEELGTSIKLLQKVYLNEGSQARGERLKMAVAQSEKRLAESSASLYNPRP